MDKREYEAHRDEQTYVIDDPDYEIAFRIEREEIDERNQAKVHKEEYYLAVPVDLTFFV